MEFLYPGRPLIKIGPVKRKSSLGCIGTLIFLVVGGVLAGIGFFGVIKPELEVNRSFVENQCTILGKRVESYEKRVRRNKTTRRKTYYRPEFHIQHEVAGQSYEARTWRIVQTSSTSKSSQEKILDRFEIGKTYPCWYDPKDPARVVLDKGLSAGGIALVSIGGIFLLLGAGAGLRSLARRSGV